MVQFGTGTMNWMLALASKRFLHIFTVVVGLGLLVGVGFYLKDLLISRSYKSLDQPQTSTSITSQTNPAANWKSYTNDSLGFALKYPSDWLVSEDIGPQGGFIRFAFEQKGINETGNSQTTIKTITIFVDNYNGSNSYLDKVENDLVEPEKFEIDSIPGVKGFDKYDLDKYSIRTYKANIAKDPWSYIIITGAVTDEKEIDTFNQILSTFHFLK